MSLITSYLPYLYFIVGLGLLIFIHELGHFLVAKWSGIRVERFSLGFGPVILKYKMGETEYCLSLLPLGGYVKMTGQEDFGEEEVVALDDPRAFNRKPLKNRLAVVFAGPVMNLVLPFFLMPLVFLIGRSEMKVFNQPPVVVGVRQDSSALAEGIQVGDRIVSIDGQATPTWTDAMKLMAKPAGSSLELEVQRGSETFRKKLSSKQIDASTGGFVGIEPLFFIDVDPVIGEVSPNTPASNAGAKADDRVVSINGTPVENWIQMSDIVNASGGNELAVIVKRDNAEVPLKIKPKQDPKSGKYILGVIKASNPDYYETRRYGLGEAVKEGFKENVLLIGMTFKVLKDLVTLKASYTELGGPVRIAQISAQAAKRGFGNFLFLLAFLSIQLGILNLLPIPVLDGGHVAFMLYESIARKPLSPKVRMVMQFAGMSLLLLLMVAVTVNDVRATSFYQSVVEFFKGKFG